MVTSKDIGKPVCFKRGYEQYGVLKSIKNGLMGQIAVIEMHDDRTGGKILTEEAVKYVTVDE